MAYMVFAADQMKTTETIIADSDIAISSNQSYPFALYVGDNLAGVINPLKSLHFTASGVYTGNGTITFMIDGDAATSKTYTLPNAGTTPTPFEIEYKDDSGKINPASAGSYSYSLNFNPSGVTVYGLGIKMTESHRYAPPACGGLPPFGDLISAVFDSTGVADGAGYNSVLWKGALGGPGTNEGHVKFQFASSGNVGGPWTFVGPSCVGGEGDWFEPVAPGTPIELLVPVSCATPFNNNQYFRYKIRICSSDCIISGTYTPTVQDVVVNWAP
ncbi:MAG: hypothetical protein M0P64_00655 [Candidatus Pacebacteria bacterium]|nr:hypothetical protein [Candidatus Paceibacterota bacterium]